MNKADRLWEVQGKMTPGTLSDQDFKDVVKMWRSASSDYDAFWKRFERSRHVVRQHNGDIRTWRGPPMLRNENQRKWQTMSEHIVRYDRVMYAGYLFATKKSQSSLKNDNSNIKMPYYTVEHGRRVLKSAFGSISRIFLHEMYPAGPKQCLLDVDWFKDEGVSEVSGNALVDIHICVRELASIGNCYQIPVAVP